LLINWLRTAGCKKVRGAAPALVEADRTFNELVNFLYGLIECEKSAFLEFLFLFYNIEEKRKGLIIYSYEIMPKSNF
jgi:hypothetical protein